MTVSFFRYDIQHKRPETAVQQKPLTATDKEVRELKREKSEKQTPREIAELPNGYTVTTNIPKVKFSAEELFDLQYKSATTLSNGSKLIRPISLALGKVDIRPTENMGEYSVTISANVCAPERKYTARTMSEKELLSNRALSRGTIKPSEEHKGRYELSFKDIHGKEQRFLANKKGCLKLLEENMLYM